MAKISIPIVGLPNVGKSTLLNSLMGEKVSIVTHKPHTTRSIQFLSKDLDGAEVVFADTPGLDKVSNKLGTVIYNNMQSYLKSLDSMMLVLDSSNPRFESFIPYIDKSIVVLNKIDHVRKHKLLPIISSISKLNPIQVFCVCAKTGYGVKDILSYLKEASLLDKVEDDFAQEYFSKEDILTYACEVVREKILLQFEQEVPYNVFIKVKNYLLPKQSAWKLYLDIVVPKDSYKPILIGKKCDRLKNIGRAARLEISMKLRQPGFLGLQVVVDENLWKKGETYTSLGWSI